MNQNPYLSPEESKEETERPILAATNAAFLWHALFLAIIALVLIFVVPAFTKAFVELELKIPAPTELIIALSRLAVRYWYLAVLAAPFYYFFLFGLKWGEQRRGLRGLSSIWAAIFWLGGILFIAATVFALAVPILAVMSALAK